MIATKLPPALFACLATFSLAIPIHAVTLINDNTFNTSDWNASKVRDTTLSGDALVVTDDGRRHQVHRLGHREDEIEEPDVQAA